MKYYTTTTSVALLAAALIAAPAMAQSRSLVLNAPAASDLRPAALVTAPAMPLANDRREAVAFSWATDEMPSATSRPAPFQALSRQFVRTLDAAALTRGVTITTDAAGGVMRLSSASRGVTLDPDRLTLEFANGRRLSGRAASDQLVNADDLRAAGMAAPSGTLGLRLAPELGSGPVVVRYEGTLAGDAQLTLSVFDRNSDLLLSTQSAAGQFMSVADARAQVELSRASGQVEHSVNGSLRAPDGRDYPLRIDTDGQARVAAPDAVQWLPGLWEWHFHAHTRSGIERMAKTAFALAAPVARFDDSVTVDAIRSALRVTLGIEVRSAGRYEARATLLATDRGGRLVPVLISAMADWLDPGSGALTLQFDADALKARGVSAPFALRELTLTDQSRMALLEQRSEALAF